MKTPAMLQKAWNRLAMQLENGQVKKNLLQSLPFWIASIITGVIAVLYAKMFAFAENLSVQLLQWKWWSLLVVSPLAFFFSWWLVYKVAPLAKGSGIPQVMAAIELSNPRQHLLTRHLLSLKVMLVKIASSLVAVLGGAAIGREGPTIQIAASVFRQVNALLPASWPKSSKKNMVLTGAAAGLAAAFNTPLGGIVFAIEELSKNHIRHFRTALFVAVIIAGLTAQAFMGSYLYLGYPKVNSHFGWLLLLIIMAGTIAGVFGAWLARGILAILQWRSKLNKQQQAMHTIAAGLCMAVLASVVSHQVLGSGKELMIDVLFNQQQQAWYAPLLRVAGPLLSFPAGGAGGVFAPSLSAGAAIGASTAQLFTLDAATTNVVVLAGMVAFLTGVTRSPFTSAILVLEMTDRHSVIFHLMLAALVANGVAFLIDRHSLYDHLKHKYLHEAQQEEQKSSLTAKA